MKVSVDETLLTFLLYQCRPGRHRHPRTP